MVEASGTYDVIVVGSGPCGSAVAMNIKRHAPGLAERTLVIEKETHPRHKLCGGGITLLSQHILTNLGVDLTLNYVPIHEVQLLYRGSKVRIRKENIIKIVRRNRFDAALVAEVRKRGIEVREGVEVNDVRVEEDGVLLQTSTGPLRARAVVAADGAKSTVRRHIGLEGPSRICRAMEVLTPEDPAATTEFREHMALFDFSPVTDGLQGYYWDFPSSVDGEPFMNRGVFDSRVLPERPNADLKGIFKSFMDRRQRKLEEYKLMGNPGRWFDPQAEFSAPRVLLAGDAAGIEPLGGDGISCSLGYGEVVALELARAFASGDFSFAGYRDRLLAHPIGHHMAGRTQQAQFIYGKRNPAALKAIWLYLRMRSMWTTPSFFSRS